jgi:hypothetical protein
MALTSKDRRHSGRVQVYSDDEDYPTMFEYYDEWINYKDSQRDKSTTVKNIYPSEFRDEGEYWARRKRKRLLKKRLRIRKCAKKKKLARFK